MVEDNEAIRDLIVSILKSSGFEKISQAKNGKEAWDVVQNQKHDLIITDCMMPEMNGLELLKNVRSLDDERKKTPVLIITASDKSDDIKSAAKWKVNGYIVKPFSIKTILSKIAIALKN